MFRKAIQVNSANRKAAQSLIYQQIAANQTRSLVTAQTSTAYDTSKEVFKARTPLLQQWHDAAYEDKLIQLLRAIRPFKVTPEVREAANEVINKQYKTEDAIPIDKNIDFTPCFDGVETIEYDEETLTAYFGDQYKETLDEFFTLKPILSKRAMDSYLSLNTKQYNEIKEQLAEKIINWCRETSKQL